MTVIWRNQIDPVAYEFIERRPGCHAVGGREPGGRPQAPRGTWPARDRFKLQSVSRLISQDGYRIWLSSDLTPISTKRPLES
jgi:hypothetical protein